MDRDDVVCMMRVKDEARWIRRSLERTWSVCRTVVLFDDHSTDGTLHEAERTLAFPLPEGQVARDLHTLQSPFPETVDEVRDKNYLWDYLCTRLTFRAVLCLDGDEMLSQAAIRAFPTALARLEAGGANVIVMPFVYLWNGEHQRRVDGVYADIRHARLFTIDRAPNYRMARFVAHGQAGFHCGSIPERLNNNRHDMPDMPVIHWGYIDETLRQRKFEFYNRLDPGNEGEGYYRHIVAQANHLAPGPVRYVGYLDQ